MLLSGCGTELHELTVEEEELIVHSAAYILAKHNIQQKDGVSGVYIPESTEEESSESTEIEDATEMETPEGGGQTGAEGETPQKEESGLAELIGHGTDLTITCEGSYLTKNYVEGGVYSVDADAGKTFYVMQLNLTNTTEGDVAVDNASIDMVFKLIGEGANVKSEMTFLTYDFATYQGTIPAGQTVETILLFEVKEADAELISNPSLEITINNETKNVKL